MFVVLLLLLLLLLLVSQFRYAVWFIPI